MLLFLLCFSCATHQCTQTLSRLQYPPTMHDVYRLEVELDLILYYLSFKHCVLLAILSRMHWIWCLCSPACPTSKRLLMVLNSQSNTPLHSVLLKECKRAPWWLLSGTLNTKELQEHQSFCKHSQNSALEVCDKRFTELTLTSTTNKLQKQTNIVF